MVYAKYGSAAQNRYGIVTVSQPNNSLKSSEMLTAS